MNIGDFIIKYPELCVPVLLLASILFLIFAGYLMLRFFHLREIRREKQKQDSCHRKPETGEIDTEYYEEEFRKLAGFSDG